MREEGLRVAEFYFEHSFGRAGGFKGGLVEGPIEVAFAAAEDFDAFGSRWGFGIGPAWEAVIVFVAFTKVREDGRGLRVVVVAGGEA